MRKVESYPILLFSLITFLFILPNDLNTATESRTSSQIIPDTVEPLPVALDYGIDVQLLPRERKLLGSVTITWTNPSKFRVGSLHFHLYPNAYASEKTTLLRELNYHRKQETELKKLRFGYVKINEIRIVEGEELTSKIQYISLDDQNPHDETVLKIRLNKPIKPFETITIKINYILIIPEIIYKSGQAGDFFFMSQWYPQLGVLQSDGSWNCHQYHRDSGFFSNFGNFKVSITLPEQFTLGATGNLQTKIKNADGTYTFLFEEKNIQGFAWAAHPGFQEIVDKIKLKGNNHSTKIVLLTSSRDKSRGESLIECLKLAMKYYEENIFPYPLKKITLVIPPVEFQMPSSQSYPGLLCISKARGKGILPSPMTWDVIHEFGLQYWSGFIGTDRSREPWLSEGITAFFDMEILNQIGPNISSHIDLMFFKIGLRQLYYWKHLSASASSPPNQYSWNFFNHETFKINAIIKPAFFLESLKNHTGQTMMMQCLKHFAKTYKYKHPKTNDLLKLFNQCFNNDFSWAFDQFICGSTDLDQSVVSIQATQIKSSSQKFRNEIVCQRKTGYFPVDVLIKLSDGKEITYHWKERSPWKRIIMENNAPVDCAIIDPQQKVTLDRNPYNNSISLKQSKSGRSTTSIKLGLYIQAILSLIFL